MSWFRDDGPNRTSQRGLVLTSLPAIVRSLICDGEFIRPIKDAYYERQV